MLNRQSKSLMIFISSFLDAIPTPYNATYGASKAFLNNFAQSLNHEVTPNIDISILKPLYVKTRLSSFLNPKHSLLVSPEECVKSSIKDIEKGYFISYGHWKHKVIAEVVMNSKIFTKQMTKWITTHNRIAEERVKRYNKIKLNRKRDR